MLSSAGEERKRPNFSWNTNQHFKSQRCHEWKKPLCTFCFKYKLIFKKGFFMSRKLLKIRPSFESEPWKLVLFKLFFVRISIIVYCIHYLLLTIELWAQMAQSEQNLFYLKVRNGEIIYFPFPESGGVVYLSWNILCTKISVSGN